MGHRRRRHYTQSEKSEMWDRWQRGESLNEIGRRFGTQGHSSVHRIFSETGGIRPLERRRSSRSLSMSEREEISRGLIAGRSIRSIAGTLGRAPSTISREIRRNRGVRITVPISPKRPGIERSVPRPVNWLRTVRWHVLWPASCSSSGHRSRSLAGSSARIQVTRRTRCHTRRSTSACISRPAGP